MSTNLITLRMQDAAVPIPGFPPRPGEEHEQLVASYPAAPGRRYRTETDAGGNFVVYLVDQAVASVTRDARALVTNTRTAEDVNAANRRYYGQPAGGTSRG